MSNPHYIYAQFKNSPLLTAIVNDNAQAFDLDNIESQFFDNAFNLDTCVGYWLDVWGVKIGLSRVLNVPYFYEAFGFDNCGVGFDQAPFYESGTTTQYLMDDDTYRLALKTKFQANFSANSPHDYNRLLHFFFDNFLAYTDYYVTVPVPMWMLFRFKAPLEAWQKQLILDGNMIPIPAAISIRVYETDNTESFGFAGGDGQPFDNAPFQS